MGKDGTRIDRSGKAINTPKDLDGKPIGGGPWLRIDGLEFRLTPQK